MSDSESDFEITHQLVIGCKNEKVTFDSKHFGDHECIHAEHQSRKFEKLFSMPRAVKSRSIGIRNVLKGVRLERTQSSSA